MLMKRGTVRKIFMKNTGTFTRTINTEEARYIKFKKETG